MPSLQELATLVGGVVVGDPATTILKLAPLDQAAAGDISFLANPKYAPLLDNTKATAVIVAPGVTAPEHLALIVCANPYLAFAKVLTTLHVRRPAARGVLPGASVDASAKLGTDITIHPGCVVGAGVVLGDGVILYPNVVLYDGVTIGADSVIHAGVTIREGCRLGERVIVQPGAVIGSDGFGFAPDGEAYFKIPQVGIVVIEDDVEIGANTCVDRAALGVTRVGKGSKLDNLVQIAHNVVVGEHTVMAGQSGVAGSTKIGRHCTVGGQTAITGHIKVGDHLTFGGKAGVTGDINGEPGSVFSGMPAIPHKEWVKASLAFNKLPEMRKELKHLARSVKVLEESLKEK